MKSNGSARHNGASTATAIPLVTVNRRDDAPPTAVASRTDPWTAASVLGTVVALALPFNSELPSAPRGLWFCCIVALISVPILTRAGLRPLFPAVWAFAGYAALVAIVTATKAATVGENLFVGAQLVLLLGFGPFAMTANALVDPSFVKRVSAAFLVGQSLSAVAAISQLAGTPILGAEPLQGRAYGLAEHPNSLGLLSSIAILVALQMLLSGRRFRWLAFAALGANVLTLIASGSVSSMMALSVGLAVLVVCNRNLISRLVVGGVACAVVLWLIGKFSGIFTYLPSVMTRYGQVTGRSESVSSWDLRTLTYEFAWEKISEEPFFGVGLAPKFSGTFNGITVTHNLFLRAWYQGGVLLAIAMAFIVAAVLVVAVRVMLQKCHGGEASVLVAVLAFALTSAMFEQRHYWLPFLVAWGSISAAALREGGIATHVLPNAVIDTKYPRAPRSHRQSGSGRRRLGGRRGDTL